MFHYEQISSIRNEGQVDIMKLRAAVRNVVNMSKVEMCRKGNGVMKQKPIFGSGRCKGLGYSQRNVFGFGRILSEKCFLDASRSERGRHTAKTK